MLSIPTVEKTGDDYAEHPESYWPNQPVKEVMPGEDGYDAAVEAARARLSAFRASSTGNNCPDNTDLVDANVILSERDTKGLKRTPAPFDEGVLAACEPLPWREGFGTRCVDLRYDMPTATGPNGLPLGGVYLDGVPDNDHWVPVDTTDPTESWAPRRSDWRDILVTRTATSATIRPGVIDDINRVKLTAANKKFSTEPMPMGLWDPACHDSDAAQDAPTVADLRSMSTQDLHAWVGALPADQDDKPVHQQSRGQAVFRAICQNCHGSAADSISPLAATIQELTGGQTRVANFVDGILGPRLAPGQFAAQEFIANNGATPEEWQVRYMLLMALGGTLANIPQSVVTLVINSPFYGKPVQVSVPSDSAANMLEAAVQMCFSMIKADVVLNKDLGLEVGDPAQRTFVDGTGHYELWRSLCQRDNAPLIRVLGPSDASTNTIAELEDVYRSVDDDGNWVYPPGAAIGDDRGRSVVGLRLDNKLPWCIRAHNLDSATMDRLTAKLDVVGKTLDDVPVCPPGLFATAYGNGRTDRIYNLFVGAGASGASGAYRTAWLRKGAINAGIAAYYFLDQWTRGQLTPVPDFDYCKN